MRVLKTMNTVGEIKRDDFVSRTTLDNIPGTYRRGVKSIDKVS